MKMKAIEISNVSKHYDNRAVVDNVSFSVDKGEFVSIVGKSGSGKSTLMNMIGSMILPDSGKIIVGGKDIVSFREREVADYRNKTIGFIFQDFHLEPTYTVYENVTLPLEIAGDRRDMKNRAKKVLERFGMSEHISKKVTALSGGEQQRVCIARAVIREPELLLADEPCGNLDTVNSDIIMKLLRELSDNGTTVLLVTHNLEAASMTDRIITLQDGALISDKRTRI
ncbi:MAG: ABC transporter ATP-binding protein [Ruminococcus sp.]|nr:ABC transporter ATP-binding protein [Ruminococcus sp.]